MSTIDINRIMEMIPHRYPILLVDRVLELMPGESATSLKNVTMNEPHFMGHFPGYPVMPGVLIVEAMAQTAAIDPLEIPLYLLTLLFMALGFIFGAFIMWMNTAPTRRSSRQQRKTIKALEKELANAQNKKTSPANAPPSELFRALPTSAAEKHHLA